MVRTALTHVYTAKNVAQLYGRGTERYGNLFMSSTGVCLFVVVVVVVVVTLLHASLTWKSSQKCKAMHSVNIWSTRRRDYFIPLLCVNLGWC